MTHAAPQKQKRQGGVKLARYADFVAAGLIIAYAASMGLGLVPNGAPYEVRKTDCDTSLYPYDKAVTTCRALRQDKGWPFVTNQEYTNAQPVEGYVLPATEFVAPRCGKRCGDFMTWNGILAATVIMGPVAAAYTYTARKQQ